MPLPSEIVKKEKASDLGGFLGAPQKPADCMLVKLGGKLLVESTAFKTDPIDPDTGTVALEMHQASPVVFEDRFCQKLTSSSSQGS